MEGSQCIAEVAEEEKSIVHIVAAGGLAEADHGASVGKERRNGMFVVVGAGMVRVGGELGAGDNLSTVVVVEKFGIAAVTVAEVQRADANIRCTCLVRGVAG